jgi:hypothetical protein
MFSHCNDKLRYANCYVKTVADEIINYVLDILFFHSSVYSNLTYLFVFLSVVQFLSMKLAAVNPRPDLNIEALLSKDVCKHVVLPIIIFFSKTILYMIKFTFFLIL